jgi:hypothetical protein
MGLFWVVHRCYLHRRRERGIESIFVGYRTHKPGVSAFFLFGSVRFIKKEGGLYEFMLGWKIARDGKGRIRGVCCGCR